MFSKIPVSRIIQLSLVAAVLVGFVAFNLNKQLRADVAGASLSSCAKGFVYVLTDPVKINEGESSTLTFKRTGPTSSPLTVPVTALDTPGFVATYKTDYTLTPDLQSFKDGVGTITFGAGQSTVTIKLTALTDQLVEFTERAILTIDEQYSIEQFKDSLYNGREVQLYNTLLAKYPRQSLVDIVDKEIVVSPSPSVGVSPNSSQAPSGGSSGASGGLRLNYQPLIKNLFPALAAEEAHAADTTNEFAFACGKVTDATTKKPLEKIEVEVRTNSGFIQALTDKNGDYLLILSPSYLDKTVTVYANGFRQGYLGNGVDATLSASNVNIQLKKSGYLWGNVRTASGKPAPNYTVCVYDTSNKSRGSVLTDSNGKYELSFLSPAAGEKLRMKVINSLRCDLGTPKVISNTVEAVASNPEPGTQADIALFPGKLIVYGEYKDADSNTVRIPLHVKIDTNNLTTVIEQSTPAIGTHTITYDPKDNNGQRLVWIVDKNDKRLVYDAGDRPSIGTFTVNDSSEWDVFYVVVRRSGSIVDKKIWTDGSTVDADDVCKTERGDLGSCVKFNQRNIWKAMGVTTTQYTKADFTALYKRLKIPTDPGPASLTLTYTLQVPNTDQWQAAFYKSDNLTKAVANGPLTTVTKPKDGSSPRESEFSADVSNGTYRVVNTGVSSICVKFMYGSYQDSKGKLMPGGERYAKVTGGTIRLDDEVVKDNSVATVSWSKLTSTGQKDGTWSLNGLEKTSDLKVTYGDSTATCTR